MKISTKGRYGLRLMIELVMNDGKRGPVSLQQVARHQDLSEKYLWQIASRLKAAGLIGAIPGAKGGFALAKPPQDITIADIVEALEGKFSVVPCVETSSVCPRGELCVSREVWREMNERIAEVMKSVTLRDVMRKQSDMMVKTTLTYTI